MIPFLLLLLQLSPAATGKLIQSECRQLDYPSRLSLPGRSICVQVRAQGSARHYDLALLDKDGAVVSDLPLSLGADEKTDPDKLQVFELKTETIVFLPVEKAPPGRRPEGYALLLRHHRKTDKLFRLKARWTCRRPCESQFLSYMTGGKKTEFYYETRVDGQHMKSSFLWKGGRMVPMDIEEPRSADALSRGHKAPPSTPVCQRTAQVATEIQRRLKVSRCEDISETDLRRVTHLALSRKGITQLRPGDFSGLSRLTQLELSHNPLEELPPGLFDGLFLLRSANFQGCRLGSLPGGVFSHLGSLKSLYLNHNRIEKLPMDAFEGLSSLRFLSLNHNRLKQLPEGLFEPLNKKCNIYLSNNPLKN